jgi:curli biogenesis system outer membrane secretion channel CsgG
MKRLMRSAALIAALVLLSAPEALAQAKIKIAIWEFENHAENRWPFWNELAPAARNQVDTEFSENPALAARFSVIERERLSLVMKEQGLATSGALDPQTAARVGRILGIQYILTGAIDKFTINNTRAGLGAFGGVGGNLLQANATINIRLIDTTTAERLVSVSADGETRSGGGFSTRAGASASREAEWGIASEAVQKTAKAVAAKFAGDANLARLSAVSETAAAEGLVIRVEGQQAWINLGATAGVKVGDKYTILDVGEALVDPVTGARLGAVEKQTATGTVSEVQERFAVITFTGAAKIRDTVRKQ